MIDPADQLTQALPLEEQPAKRKRGRPSTGKAMTPAQKQKAYRERLKSRNVTLNAVPAELLEQVRAEAAERIEQLEKQLEEAKRTVGESQKSNVTEKRSGWVIQMRTKTSKRYKTLTGEYKSEAEAETALLDLPESAGWIYRVRML